MKLSPYGFDIGRLVTLVTRPNLRLETLSNVPAPDDSVFPESGLIEIPGAVPGNLCDEAVRQHEEFEAFRERKNCAIRDANGRNYRLTNFHLKCPPLLQIGLSDDFHRHSAAFFRRPSTVYTSLFYKHGSQQDAHIDTPYFWTRPFNLYVGLWVALEDIKDTAGPLFYYPGSHKFFSSEAALKDVHAKAGGDVQAMFRLMRQEIERTTQPVRMLLKKGDAVIWHPGILHGGTKATDPHATRYSTVFHLAPLGVNVSQDAFPRNFVNLPTYGVLKKGGNYYCRGALPRVMI